MAPSSSSSSSMEKILSPADHMKLLRWELFYRSATVIQRSWRRYMVRATTQTQRHQRRRGQLITKTAAPPLDAILSKAMANAASTAEKFELWRSVIELRRTRNGYSTDACVRSLIECKGDVARTLLISGNATFGWRNASDLAHDSRHTLLPGTGPAERHAAVGVAALKRLKDERVPRAAAAARPLDLAALLAKMYYSKNYRNPQRRDADD